jgi:RNA polymerase sigma-54 factor
MELGLFQEQRLKLVMTNELRQAINILHYSSLELADFLQEQALDNPLIDVQEMSWSHQYDRKKSTAPKSESSFEFADRREPTLQEHLLKQIYDLQFDKISKEILKYMVLMIDNNGYFPEDISVIASEFSVGEEEVEQLLKNGLQQLEPFGVGARNLKECLLIQLSHLPVTYELAEEIICNHLTPFAEKKWKELSQKLNISLQQLQAVFDFIQTLDPKPGSRFPSEKVEFIVPDLMVERDGSDFRITINDSSMPSISINHYYQRLLQTEQRAEINQYISEKYQRFLWLQKSIEQRRLTLIKVMTSILQKQRSFFERGERFMKPLTLKEIAEDVDIHESTVSRATNGKYVQTPFGLYELKQFFTSSIQTDSDDAVSSSVVKQTLKEVIENEDKRKPLSDQKIASIMKNDHHLQVSRRTIAKYREQLNIPSSTLRKRFE